MPDNNSFDRIVLIVLDSLGMGEMPDAAAWGDAGADTLGHICASREVRLPNLQALGLRHGRPLAQLPRAPPGVSWRARGGRLPNLRALGLGNVRPLAHVPPAASPRGAYGRCALQSNGKDTTTRHWAHAGRHRGHACP